MTLEQYFAILLKQWRLIILCFVVAGAGSYGASRLMTPIYESTALVQIAIANGNNQMDFYSSLLASNQLVQTEATLATSDPILRDVAARYQDVSVDRLSKEVTAVPKPDTQLFAISVQDPDPNRAADLANDVAATLILHQSQLVQRTGNLNGNFLVIAQTAQPSSTPIRPNVTINTGAGVLIGLLLGMVLAIFFERLDVRVRT